jgi:hypothetical protein
MKCLTTAGLVRLVDVIRQELERRGVGLLDDRAWFFKTRDQILAPENEGVMWFSMQEPHDPNQLNLF